MLTDADDVCLGQTHGGDLHRFLFKPKLYQHTIQRIAAGTRTSFGMRFRAKTTCAESAKLTTRCPADRTGNLLHNLLVCHCYIVSQNRELHLSPKGGLVSRKPQT
jgi:hypothetical protein